MRIVVKYSITIRLVCVFVRGSLVMIFSAMISPVIVLPTASGAGLSVAVPANKLRKINVMRTKGIRIRVSLGRIRFFWAVNETVVSEKKC
jgi:hypothetical protein